MCFYECFGRVDWSNLNQVNYYYWLGLHELSQNSIFLLPVMISLQHYSGLVKILAPADLLILLQKTGLLDRCFVLQVFL